VDEGRLRLESHESLRRRRLVVLLRLILFVPHYIVIAIWTMLAAPAAAIAWLALLIEGRLPTWLHRFIAAYVRYLGQSIGWLYLLSGRYPDPLHTREHPLAVEIAERPRQRRLLTLFRLPLAIPAVVLASVFRVVLSLAAIAAWFAGLAIGRTTAGLQELGTFCLRYELETLAYILLVSPRYPRVAPAVAPQTPQ